MGWNNKFHCEWEDFPRKVLKYHFPNAISYGDIKQTDFTIWRGRIDILTGDFHANHIQQQASDLANKMNATCSQRCLEQFKKLNHVGLWEKTFGDLLIGMKGWYSKRCRLTWKLEGYKVQPFLLPACGVGAPHRRDRIWFVAFKDSNKNGWGSIEWKEESEERRLRNISTRDNERIQANNEQGSDYCLPRWLNQERQIWRKHSRGKRSMGA